MKSNEPHDPLGVAEPGRAVLDDEIRRWYVTVEGWSGRFRSRDAVQHLAASLLDTDTDHDRPDGKLWSVGQVAPRGAEAGFEVTTLTTALGDRLLSRVAELSVSLGENQVRFAAEPQRRISWRQVENLSAPHTVWWVNLLTPTTFARYRDCYSPWPDPFVMWRSGRGRFEAMAPRELVPLWPATADGVVVREFTQLRAERCTMDQSNAKARILTGMTGQLCFEALTAKVSVEERRRWDLALSFFELAGMGHSTTAGLGRADVVRQRRNPWAGQPRPARRGG